MSATDDRGAPWGVEREPPYVPLALPSVPEAAGRDRVAAGTGPGAWPAPTGAGWPGPAPVPAPQETSSAAIVALVLAIGSFVVLPLFPAIAALLVARHARREIEASGQRLAGEGLVRAAVSVAWVNVALCGLALIGVVVLVVVLLAQVGPT